MPYNIRRKPARGSGHLHRGPAEDDHGNVPETQRLLAGGDPDVDNAGPSSSAPPRPPPTRSKTGIICTMGFKALTERVVFFRHHQERSPLERDLVRRLDFFLMSFGCVSQVIKYLDQSNINNAYVSGMKEDLGLYGNELNYFTTYFSISYCIFLIPSQIIMTWVRPSWWLPGLEIAWGIVTGLIALCHNASQVYVLRVFLGIFESSAWPGMMTLFMYWYTPFELAKRMGFYHSCQAVGYMMSGAIQTAIVNTVDGAHGIAGWRWLFIINCVMTIAVAIVGAWFLPDYPSNPNPRAFWLTAEHVHMAQARLDRHGRAGVKRITWPAAKRTFTMAVAYLVPILYIATVLAQYGYNYFNLFLKSIENPDGSKRWSTSDVNSIPIGGGAINVVVVWIWAILSDILQMRWPLLIAQAAIGLVPGIALSIWTRHPDSTPIATAYAGYFISYISLGTAPLIFSWLADMIPQDSEARTLIVGYAIAGTYAFIAWSQVLIWPSSEAPYYRFAWQVCIGLWTFVIFMVVLLRYIDLRFLLPKRVAACPTVIEAAEDADDDVVDVPGDALGKPVSPTRRDVESVA